MDGVYSQQSGGNSNAYVPAAVAVYAITLSTLAFGRRIEKIFIALATLCLIHVISSFGIVINIIVWTVLVAVTAKTERSALGATT